MYLTCALHHVVLPLELRILLIVLIIVKVGSLVFIAGYRTKVGVTVGKGDVLFLVVVGLFPEHLAQLHLVELGLDIGSILHLIFLSAFEAFVLRRFTTLAIGKSGGSSALAASVSDILVLDRELADLLSAREQLDTLVRLTKETPLVLQVDDELFSLAALNAHSILVECEAVLPSDNDVIASNLQAAAVRHGRPELFVLLVKSPSASLATGLGQRLFHSGSRARIRQLFHLFDCKVAQTSNMYPLALGGKVRTTEVTGKFNRSVAFLVFFDLGGVGDITVVVDDGIRVGVAPNERARVLHDGQEAGEVVDFAIGVTAVQDTGKVEKVGTLVEFAPKSVL